jgi:hypothetical protein
VGGGFSCVCVCLCLSLPSCKQQLQNFLGEWRGSQRPQMASEWRWDNTCRDCCCTAVGQKRSSRDCEVVSRMKLRSRKMRTACRRSGSLFAVGAPRRLGSGRSAEGGPKRDKVPTMHAPSPTPLAPRHSPIRRQRPSRWARSPRGGRRQAGRHASSCTRMLVGSLVSRALG